MSTRKRFDVEIPDGRHLGFSRDTGGAYRAHLFDDETNELVGHAELFEPEEDEWGESSLELAYEWTDQSVERDYSLDDLAEALANLVALGILIAAAPHVRGWWNEKVLPTVKSTSARITWVWKRVARSRPVEEEIVTGELVTAERPRAESSNDVDLALQKLRIEMSSAEARQRFVAAIVAKAFADEQLRLLRAASIEDGEDSAELDMALKELTPERVQDTINWMLENDPALLDRETLAEFGTLLDRGRSNPQHLQIGGAGSRQGLSPADRQPMDDPRDASRSSGEEQ